MKRKTIAKVLRKKFRKFTESIDDPIVRREVQKNSMITGGAITSMFYHENVNDYDVYFTDAKTCQLAAEYFVDRFNRSHPRDGASVEIGKGVANSGFYKPKFEDDRISIFIKSNGVAGEPQAGMAGEQLGDTVEEFEQLEQEEEDKGYEPVFLSQNAITLSGRIQLIIRFFGTPDEIHKNYDFAHCTNYWLSKDSKVYLNEQALESMLTKELVYIGSKYPVCSIIRTRKFIKRGFSITAGTYLKMILQCNELDLFDVDVLEDQLTGVDSAYFMQVISAIRSDKPERMNSAYLAEIIDRIF